MPEEDHSWWTHSQCTSKLEPVSMDELAELLSAAPPARDINEIILHHTWEPRVAGYQGRPTWRGIQRYHQSERGWSDIGYHVGVASDRTIWLLRPVTRGGAHCLHHNRRSVGVGMIGNYDTGHDDPATILPTAAQVCRLLTDRYQLAAEDVWFHRDFADKSCPGTGIDRTAFRELVAQAGETLPVPPAPPETTAIKVIRHGSGEMIAEYEMVRGGDHVADQGKLYVRE